MDIVLNFITNNPIWSALILLIILAKPLLILIRISYANFRVKDLVYLKVTMPRQDSQKDKENTTEKDFKEIIGSMEQFYRAVHEIHELNLGNIIKTRIFKSDFISFEITIEKKLAVFHIVTYPEYRSIIEKQITSYYNDADIVEEKPPGITKKGYNTKAYYVYERNPYWFPIKTYKNIEKDPLNGITNVLSKLEDDEMAAVQMIIRPRNDKWREVARKKGEEMFKNKKENSNLFKIPVFGWILKFMSIIFWGPNNLNSEDLGTNAPGASGGDSFVRMLQTDEEVAKKIGEKSQQNGFETIIRILATTKTAPRTQEILNNLTLAFNQYEEPAMNYFQTRRILFINTINTPLMVSRYKRRIHIFSQLNPFTEKQSIMTPEELSSVYHLPNSIYNKTPIIKWLSYKVLAPPPDMPNEGVLLGNNVYRGAKTPVHMLPKDRTKHHYVIGKSGTGKSAFISYVARQDIQNGEGVCVIDPHGDLIEDLLQYIPKERVKDVVVFNPADQDRPMGLNMLEADTPEKQDLASSQATEIFIKLFGNEIFGPRIQHYFRNACLTLMEDKEEGATLIDVPRIFTDDAFMKYKVSRTKNPVVKSFWEHEYANTGERERQEMIPYFSSKFGPFITNSIIRNVIGQTKSAFDFRKIMDEQKILLINLSKGKIGDLNTQLLGLIIVARIQMAAMSRADMPEDERKPFYLYVDEFQNFSTDSFASILSEARKYKLCLIMAHQYINQLTEGEDTKIRDAVFGNVGTMQSFKIGAEDAEYMSKEYAPLLSEQDIIGISNYKAYIKLNINNTTSRPFSMEAIWDPSGANKKIAKVAKEYSRMKYGRKFEFVDKEIRDRIGIGHEDKEEEPKISQKPEEKDLFPNLKKTDD